MKSNIMDYFEGLNQSLNRYFKLDKVDIPLEKNEDGEKIIKLGSIL